MSGATNIQWAHVPGYVGATWNPTTGCTRVSPGCNNCYAFELHDQRYAANKAASEAAGFTRGAVGERYIAEARKCGIKLPLPAQYDVPFSQVQLLDEKRLTEPLGARKPRAYFVDSMADLFHQDVPDEFIDSVFEVMALCPQHIFMVLTKRPERMHALLGKWAEDGYRGAPNVWLGVSVEDQERADKRIPWLLATPAAVRFLSCEPLLGPVDLVAAGIRYDGRLNVRTGERAMLHWVIAGGESGRHARPFDLASARSLRDQCAAAGVPFFMKQLGRIPMWDPAEGDPKLGPDVSLRAVPAGWEGQRRWFLRLRSAHGADPSEWPDDLRVRDWPEVVR